MADETKKDPKALVRQILGGQNAAPNDPTAEPFADAGRAPDELTEEQVREWIDLYFVLEDPIERDVLFDRLAVITTPLVTEFLLAMMQHDQDEFLRAAAAAVLARRGHPAALARLDEDLRAPAELFFFSHALEVLADLRGPSFYATAAQLWRDPSRDAAERREAMLAMEAMDVSRALVDFVQFIASITDVRTFADDQVEASMAAFVRHDHRAALPVLHALRQRILAASWEDAAERDEMAAFVREGIELLEA